ncbi:MAG: hypothetical protein JXP73_06585, partial [Deltaproteobacteria bacterium]|nr:hypothetical protein [Deltaproteobacteria bacterium]
MPTRHSAFLPIVSLFLCTTFLLASCTTQDNALGSEGKSDGGRDVKATDVRAVTCEQDGKTYQVGETVILSACTSCVCQADGTVGLCTGTCPPDAAIASDGPVTCTQNGKTYQVGETVILSACTSCVCQA